MITRESIADELQTWKGTNYSHGVSVKQGGVDCVRFAVSMLEWAHGRIGNADCIPYDFTPQAAWSERWCAQKMYAWMSQRYPNTVVYKRKSGVPIPTIQPLDVLVLENSDDSPCHMMIGGLKGEIWHANSSATGGDVRWSGLTDLWQSKLLVIWRMNIVIESNLQK